MPEGIGERKRHRAVLLFAIAVLAMTSTISTAGRSRSPDYLGLRFRCGDLASDRVCLPSLQPDCKLKFIQGKMIPRKAAEHLVVECRGEVSRLWTSNDLSGCVRLASSQDALEYLRFFSSLWTIHLFEQEFLEIFPARKRKRSCF